MKRQLITKTEPNLNEILPADLWPQILSYLTVWQRMQIATVCKAWCNDRGFIDQSIVSLKKSDAVPLNFRNLVNLKAVETYWNHTIDNAIRHRGLIQLTKLKLVEKSRAPQTNKSLSVISLLTNLSSLQVGWGFEDHLEILSKLTSLTDIRLSLNQLGADKTDRLHSLTGLRKLRLSRYAWIDNSLFTACTNLKSLKLYDCFLINAPCIMRLTQLSSLAFIGTSKIAGGYVLSYLTNLTVLNISTNTSFLKDMDIIHLSSLVKLNIANQPLLTSDILNYFPHLTSLILCQVGCLNTSLDDKYLARNITKLTNLKRLDFGTEQVPHLKVETLLKLSNLTSLRMIYNHTIEPSFVLLTNLKILKFSYQSLAVLEASYLPSSLQRLSFRSCENWEHLIEPISNRLLNLRELRLGTPYKDISTSFKGMSRLSQLDCIFYPKICDEKENQLYNSYLKQAPSSIQTIVYQ